MVWFFTVAALIAFGVAVAHVASGQILLAFAVAMLGLSLTFGALTELRARRYERVFDPYRRGR